MGKFLITDLSAEVQLIRFVCFSDFSGDDPSFPRHDAAGRRVVGGWRGERYE